MSIFEDYDDSAGLTLIGGVLMILFLGFTPYLIYQAGYQNALKNVNKCNKQYQNCSIDEKKAWYGSHLKITQSPNPESEKKD